MPGDSYLSPLKLRGMKGLSILFALVVLAMGATTEIVAQEEGKNPIYGEWIFSIYHHGIEGSTSFPPTEMHKPIKVLFNDDMTFHGNSFRAYVYGTYSMTGNRLKITQFSITQNEKENTWGKIFLRVFPKIDAFELRGDTLKLFRYNTQETLDLLPSIEYPDAEYLKASMSSDYYIIPAGLNAYFNPDNRTPRWVYEEERSMKKDTSKLVFYDKKFERRDLAESNKQSLIYTVQSSYSEGHNLYVRLIAKSRKIMVADFTSDISGGLPMGENCDTPHLQELADAKVESCNYQFELVNSVDIKGTVYENVIKAISTNPEKGTAFKVGYFKEGIGLIRKEYSDGTSWNLIHFDPNW